MTKLDKSILDIEDIKSFDVKEYIFKVASHWKLFLIVLFFALSITFFVNKRKQRIYSLSSIITVKEESNPLFTSNTNIAFNWGGPSDKVETIITILKSRTHNEKVVKKLKYYVNYLEEGSFRLEDVYGKTPFNIQLDSTRSHLLNVPIKLKFLDTDKVVVSTELETEEASVIDYRDNSIESLVFNTKNFEKSFDINQVIELPFIKFRVIKKYPEMALPNKEYYILLKNFNATVSKYQNINARALTEGTSLIELELKGSNKKKIEDYINMTVEVLDEAERNQKIQYAIKTKEYIDTVFDLAASNLKTIEKDLGDFKQKNEVYDLSVEGEKLFEEVSELDKQREQVKNRLQYFTNLGSYISSNKEIGSQALAPVNVNIEDSNISKNIIELIELSKQKKNLEGTVTSNYPGLKKINDQIGITRNVVLENLNNLQSETRNNLSNINRRLAGYKSRLKKLPKKEQGLLTLQRTQGLTATNYEYLKQKQYEAGTAIAANVSDIKILDKAKDIGQKPISPKTTFNYLLAAVFGFGIPFLYVLIKEALNNKILSVEEIERIYEIPVLGVIGSGKLDNYLAVFNKPKSQIAESFRALRSNIQFLFKSGNKSKTIVVTSSVSGEGKTLTSINMASVFAMSDKKTILLGLDLRKPKLHLDFNVANDIGVVNYLIGQNTIDDIIQPTKIPNLSVITSGPVPPNPSELLLNNATKEMMAYLKENYDYIIIDTPPVGLVADAIELFKYADATVYIIRQNYTQKMMPKMIDDKYKNGEILNISYVLNDFSTKDGYGYGYGYGYAGYGYGKYGNGYHQNEKEKSWIKKIFTKKN